MKGIAEQQKPLNKISLQTNKILSCARIYLLTISHAPYLPVQH